MRRWTGADWTLLLRFLGIVFGGIVALSVLTDRLQGFQPPPARDIGYVVAVVGIAALSWLAGVLLPFDWLYYVRTALRRASGPPGSRVVDLGLARDLSSAITQGLRVWNTQDQLYEESFAVALSKIGDQINAFPQATRTVQQADFIGQSGGARYGWGAASSLITIIEIRLAEISGDPANMTVDEFLEGLTLLCTLASSGASAATVFVQPARAADALGTSPYLAKEWNEKFVASANALAKDVRRLGDQAKVLFGVTQSFYVRQVPTY